MDPYAVGIDLGGSHVAVGLLDKNGTLQSTLECKVNNLAPPDITLGLIADTVKQVAKPNLNICGIGIGLPGNHDSTRGICRFSPNFPAWHDVEVTPFLSKILQRPVFMLNDVRMATLGELHFGAGKGIGNLVMLAIGTGIGGGVVVDGKLHIGAKEAAGEIGHLIVDPNGPLCNCGNRGCMEAFASGPSITARGIEAVVRGQPTTLRTRVKALEEITPKLISEAALEGDPVANRILREAGEAVGIGIVSLAVTLNPDRFIIGGGVALTGPPLFAGIHETVARRLTIVPPESLTIVPAELGVRAGMVGAGAFAFIRCGVPIS